MKPTLKQLPILLVYAIKYASQTNMLTGQAEQVPVPTGEVHIFRVASKELGALQPYSMCGKEASKIGEKTKATDKRPANLPMCSECEAKWKNHPEGPWKAWKKGKALKAFIPFVLILALASLACLQTTINEEVGSAAPSTAPLPTEGTPFEHPEENPAGAVYEIPAARPLCAIVTADEALHLRTEPNEKADHIEYLVKGQQLDILNYGAWWKVRTESGTVGFANARYLEAELCEKS